MFNIGMPEMLIILALALIVFGPNKLPELAKGLGKALREFKKATEEMKGSFHEETRILEEIKSTLPQENLLERLAEAVSAEARGAEEGPVTSPTPASEKVLTSAESEKPNEEKTAGLTPENKDG